MEPATKQLFVDTNVFLSFYDFTDDDLQSLSKLKGLLTERHIKLFVTGQVKDEFYHNRKNKIKACLNSFDKLRFSERLPRIKTLPESQALSFAGAARPHPRFGVGDQGRSSSGARAARISTLPSFLKESVTAPVCSPRQGRCPN